MKGLREIKTLKQLYFFRFSYLQGFVLLFLVKSCKLKGKLDGTAGGKKIDFFYRKLEYKLEKKKLVPQ